MSYGTYNQYDSRWGGKNYNGSSTMAAAGCGPTSCANILHNIDPSITPITTMKYMQTHGDKEHKTFAIYGNGTAWNGITQCLKYYGAQDVQRPTKMSDVWSFLSKDYAAIFLMIYRKGLPGPTWTTGGHYIAIVDYKVKNSKHYVRVEDCGGRGHDGWYCYETQMRGWISKVWTCLAQPKEIKPIVKPTDKYNGIVPEPTLKKDSKGDDVKNLQRFLTWYGIKCSIDGSFGEKTKEAVQVFQKTEGLATDGTYGKKSAAAAKAYQKNTSAPVPTPTPDSDLPKKCIDVSYWQGKISVENWKKIKKTCGYAICRTSYTSQSKFALSKDSTFATNFKNAQAAGLKVGAYHYSQAITVAEAKKEAEYMCEILKNYSPNFYVVCDFEYGGRLNSKIGSKASNIANAFCDVVKAYGYEPCIYANTSTLNSNLTNPRYPIWVAQYNDKCTYKGNKVMWQYTSKGRVDGIEAKNTNSGSANVDLSHVYIVPKENVPSPSPVVTQTTYKGDFPNLVTHSGQKLAYVAKELAWPKGTKKATYAYGTGDATNAFKKALNKVYPDRKSWGAQPRVGASCDVGSGTAIRYSGLDTKIPRGLAQQIPHLAKSSLWKATSLKKTSEMQPGDVGIYLKPNGNGHIWIGLGDKLIAEANYKGKCYFHIDTDNYTSTNKKTFIIYRSTKASAIKKGDKGTEVKKLQKFLNWAGFDCGSADGNAGVKTENAIKAFQTSVGLTPDGTFGSKSLTEAEKVKK